MAGVRVTICGVNTKDCHLLSAKDKRELLVKVKEGDTEAREEHKGQSATCVKHSWQIFQQ